jgi:Zn-dependent peptidase ImmA (M78 family)
MADMLEIITNHSRILPVDIFGAIRDIGITAEFRQIGDDISGWIEKLSADKYLIVINAFHSKTRQRFTGAHELGHYIYHRDLLGRGVGDTRAYRSAGTPFSNAAITVQHERQANTFAANVLMPQEHIIRLRSDGVVSPRDMAQRFQVSEDAMRIRLGLPRQASLLL